MRSTTVSLRHRFGVAALLPVLALTACSGDGDNEADADPTDSASTAPSTTDGEEVAAAEVFADMAEAMGDVASSRVVIDMGILTAEAITERDDAEQDLQVSMDIRSNQGTQTIILRFVDGESFASAPPFTPPGKFWRYDEGSTELLTLAETMRNTTPSDAVANLRESTTGLTRLGEVDLDGEKVTHYRVEGRTDTALGLLGEAAPQESEQLPETFEYDLYLTEDDELRRIAMVLDGLNWTADYLDLNKEFQIDAPAPKDLVDPPKGF